VQQLTIYRAITKLKNIDLFYLDTKTEKPAMLCVHGRYGRAETWVDFINKYGDEYRVIAPELRGHGLSGKPAASYSAEEMVEDIYELLSYLKIESVIMVGHSLGGRIAAYFAASYPEKVRALAILDKSPSGMQKLYGEQPIMIDPLTKDWPMPFSSLNEAMKYIRQHTDSELSYQYFMNSLAETVDGYKMMFSSYAIALGITHDEDWYFLLPKITCLTLLIRAKGGEAVPDEDLLKMKSMLSDCLSYEMTESDHNVHLSNKKEFYGYFDEFLAEIKRSNTF